MDPTKYFSGVQLELARAIELDDPSAIDKALRNGAQVNARGTGGISPVMYAVASVRKKSFSALVDHGADLTLRAEDGHSGATLAMLLVRKDPEWLRLVIERARQDPNTRMPNGGPLLEYFVATGNRGAIKYLIEKGGDPNTRDSADLPLVISTAYAGRYDLVELLLELGGTAHLRELEPVTQLRTNLDLAPGSPEWQARERVRGLIARAKR